VINIKFAVFQGLEEVTYIAIVGEESPGKFRLDTVYEDNKRECKIKFDLALPGRLVGSVVNPYYSLKEALHYIHSIILYIYINI